MAPRIDRPSGETYLAAMTSPDAWQSLVMKLAHIDGPALDDVETAELRGAVEGCAQSAIASGLSAPGLIKRLKEAFAESALRVSRETHLRIGNRDDDDQLITKIISWALTRYFQKAAH